MTSARNSRRAAAMNLARLNARAVLPRRTRSPRKLSFGHRVQRQRPAPQFRAPKPVRFLRAVRLGANLVESPPAWLALPATRRGPVSEVFQAHRAWRQPPIFNSILRPPLYSCTVHTNV